MVLVRSASPSEISFRVFVTLRIGLLKARDRNIVTGTDRSRIIKLIMTAIISIRYTGAITVFFGIATM